MTFPDFDPRARREYDKAIRRYDREQPGLGRRFQDKVEDAIRAICDDPRRYPLYEGETEFRQYLLKKFGYSVIYSELDDRIWIIAVAHHRRKPGYWRRRKRK